MAVHRGDVEARRDPLKVGLFSCFFPLLLAGPIERAGHLVPQFERPRRLSAATAHEGMLLVLWGVFKKLVIAGYLGESSGRGFYSYNEGQVKP